MNDLKEEGKIFFFGKQKIPVILIGDRLSLVCGNSLLMLDLRASGLRLGKNSISLYGEKDNGLCRSYIKIFFGKGMVIKAMHDTVIDVSAVGGKLSLWETPRGYRISLKNSDGCFTLTLSGSCRTDGERLYIRRGRSELVLSEVYGASLESMRKQAIECFIEDYRGVRS